MKKWKSENLRLTKEAIHVYLIGETYNRNSKLPLVYYVSTFYADGSPATCNVEVKRNFKNELNNQEIARFKTNLYGAGKLEFIAPKNEDYEKDLALKVMAIDDKNKSAHRANP